MSIDEPKLLIYFFVLLSFGPFFPKLFNPTLIKEKITLTFGKRQCFVEKVKYTKTQGFFEVT